MKTVHPSKWGKDHWSLLGYVDCRCVDNGGIMNYDHLRINENINPPICTDEHRGRPRGRGQRWRPEYGTRLRGFFQDKANPKLQLQHHDDICCLEDLEHFGLIKLGTYISGFVQLTPLGSEVAGRLRAHKAKGGNFANFTDSILESLPEK